MRVEYLGQLLCQFDTRNLWCVGTTCIDFALFFEAECFVEANSV